MINGDGVWHPPGADVLLPVCQHFFDERVLPWLVLRARAPQSVVFLLMKLALGFTGIDPTQSSAKNGHPACNPKQRRCSPWERPILVADVDSQECGLFAHRAHARILPTAAAILDQLVEYDRSYENQFMPFLPCLTLQLPRQCQCQQHSSL